jgi:serine/threonine-protein kinase RsbW
MELPSSVEMLPVLRTALNLFLRRVVGVPSLEERIHLPLVEAAVNAIRHGNRQDPRRPVTITLEWNPPRLTARVEDEGDPFEPQIPAEASPTLEDHGRGLFLMKRMTDELHFSRGPRGNVVELVWRVPGPGSGQPPAGAQM